MGGEIISMEVPVWIEDRFHEVVDTIFAHIPQPVPTRDKLANCKIVSHRGEYDNRSVFENSIPAFDAVLEGGVWGIELDIRWTKDLIPVVFHDRTLQRLHGSPAVIQEMTFAELRTGWPVIPSLQEVILRYGEKMHLMVEIKQERYPDPGYQSSVLKDLFTPLSPQTDYHLISLHPEMFDLIHFVEKSCFLPIAQINVRELSRVALSGQLGGLTGHYLFLNRAIYNRHKRQGQKIGTGFIASRNCLYREINRGVDWIFSNHAAAMQKIVNQTR